MSKKMLIDAAHPEETRVAIIDDHNTLNDYDFKSTFKHTIKSNIYLAKVARVEPSLQAAFIDYGGNRHGFLAFSEIHPDYFRIPVADREQINAELKGLVSPENPEGEIEGSALSQGDSQSQTTDDDHTYKMPISTVGGELPLLEESDGENYFRKLSLHRRYKIQEVIHRNQILLVQVVKEERGGKGAALTTYLSLPGRYCVLMPNSPRSGGISRKISNADDRKRLRKVLESLEIPEGMGLIIRTAGKERTKTELKRDAEYLMRLWNTIRETTLQSIAPAIIYQEDDIIKRAIRDLYTKDMDKILVEGEEGYKIARSFMKTLMPSHTKRIQLYKDDACPLFHQYGVERQIDRMHESQVFLPSGGSIVIHPTEALVSIDINSGRATRERHIEETATKTNLEAAVEIARQVRLRDLAGLIVIDFIDMEEPRNIAAVERKVKEVFRNDRARIQVGKISPFGLLELSRQRLAPSILETSAYQCPHCNATGYIRSTESKALQILRVIEEEAMAQNPLAIMVELPSVVASYIFNNKRHNLLMIEQRHKVNVSFEFNEHLEKPGFKLKLTRSNISAETNNNEKALKKNKLSEAPSPSLASVEESSTGVHSSTQSDKQPREQETDEKGRRRKNRRPNRRKNKEQGVAQRNESPEGLPESRPNDSQERQPGFSSPDSPIVEITSRLPAGEKENADTAPQPDGESANPEKRRRNRRRNNRRHIRTAKKQNEDNAESSHPESPQQFENTSSLTSQNQNKLVREDQPAQTILNAENETANKNKNAKGWWKRLLE